MRLGPLPLLLLALSAQGQVVLDRALILNGNTPEHRQVIGLDNATTPNAVLTAAVEQGGTHRLAHAVNGTSWSLVLNSLDQPPQPGTQLEILVPSEASGPVFLTVNDHGPYPVHIKPGVPFIGGNAPPNSILVVVFDGTSFQAMNSGAHRRIACPLDMVVVDQEFCIDREERGTALFFAASLACAAEGKRLCGWGEYHEACSRAAELGLLGMTGNWEWTNDAANEDQCVRTLGNTSCTSSSVMNISAVNPIQWRCCLSR